MRLDDNLNLPRVKVFELITRATAETLDLLVNKLDAAVKVEMVKPPEAVVVMSRARETVNNSLFNLGEVLATRLKLLSPASKDT